MDDSEDKRLEIVLSEALRAVTEQQARLDNLRSRAAILLSSAALVSSFLGAPAFQQGARVDALGRCAIGALALVLLTTAAISVPLWRWDFRTSSSALLSAVDMGHDLNSVRRNLSLEFEQFVDSNDKKLTVMQWLFTLGMVALFVELSLWLAVLLRR